jgi:hypothetical protein
VQDKVLRASVVPERLRTEGLDLVYAELKGRWSKQTLTIDAYRDLKMYLKFEPRPDLDDKGIYFIDHSATSLQAQRFRARSCQVRFPPQGIHHGHR